MANLFTIPQLLVGQNYRSNSISGEIISAEKSTQPIWYGENTEAYLVGVVSNAGKYSYRTLAVKVGE
jgi:hypothetical protein